MDDGKEETDIIGSLFEMREDLFKACFGAFSVAMSGRVQDGEGVDVG